MTRIAATDRRWHRRAVAAYGLLLALVFAMATEGHAVTAEPSLSLQPQVVAPGESTVARGTGFCPPPCPVVQISVGGSVVVPSVAVDASGSFTVRVPLAPVSGQRLVVARQYTTGGQLLEASALVRVVAADLTSGPPTSPPMSSPVPSVPPPTAGGSEPPVDSASAPTTSGASGTSSVPGALGDDHAASGWWWVLGGIVLVGFSSVAAWLVARRRTRRRAGGPSDR